MKKTLTYCICCLVAVLALTACSPASVGNGGNGSDGDPLQDFKEYLAVAEGPAEAKAYLDALMETGGAKPALDTETADALVTEYLNYLQEFLMQEQTDLSEYPPQAGFKLNAGEGGDYPVIDYHFIDAYADRISQEMTDYAGFMSLNSDQPWAFDAGLAISPKQLADRIALAEQFAVRYPASAFRAQVLEEYTRYLNAFLAGLDNTPLFPFGSYKAEAKFLDAYDYFVATYPDLITTETIRDYQAELKEMNYTAPYRYLDHEKRAAFSDHIHSLVQNATGKLDQ